MDSTSTPKEVDKHSPSNSSAASSSHNSLIHRHIKIEPTERLAHSGENSSQLIPLSSEHSKIKSVATDDHSPELKTVEALRARNDKLERLLSMQTQQLENVRARMTEKEESLKAARLTASETMEQMAKINLTNAQLNRKLEELERLKDDLSRKVEESTNFSEEENEMTRLRNKCSAAEQKASELESELLKCKKDFEMSNKTIDALEDQAADLERSEYEKQKKLDELWVNIANLRKANLILKLQLRNNPIQENQDWETKCKKYQHLVPNLLSGFRQVIQLLEAEVPKPHDLNCDKVGVFDPLKKIEELCLDMETTLNNLPEEQGQITEEFGEINRNLKSLYEYLSTKPSKNVFCSSSTSPARDFVTESKLPTPVPGISYRAACLANIPVVSPKVPATRNFSMFPCLSSEKLTSSPASSSTSSQKGGNREEMSCLSDNQESDRSQQPLSNNDNKNVSEPEPATSSRKSSSSNVPHGVSPKETDSCVCGHKAKNHHNLQRHIKYYTAEPKFPCELCGEKFVEKGYLRKHIISRHEKQNVGCSQTSRPELDAQRSDNISKKRKGNGSVPSDNKRAKVGTSQFQ